VVGVVAGHARARGGAVVDAGDHQASPPRVTTRWRLCRASQPSAPCARPSAGRR
jgi:hypothetical protein